MNDGIFPLTSYSNPGNTWFRTFLTGLQRNTQAPADINEPDTDRRLVTEWAAVA